MSFPVDIPPIQGGYDFGQSIRGKFAFENGAGTEYAFIRQGGQGDSPIGDLKLHAMKSTNGGATWTEQDAVHAPALTSISLLNGDYTVAQDGNTVIVLDVVATAGSPPTITGLNKWTYSLTTDLWAGPTFSNTIIPDRVGQGSVVANEVHINLVVKGPTDYVLFYSSLQSGSGSTALGRISVVTYDGTTFGTPHQIPGQANPNFYMPVDGIYASGAALFFFSYLLEIRSGGFVVGSELHTVSWDKTTFGTDSAVTTQVNLVAVLGAFSPFILYTLSGTETLGIAGLILQSAVDKMAFYSASTTTNLIWSSANIISTINVNSSFMSPAFYLNPMVVALTVFNGRLYCLWIYNDTGTPLENFQESDSPLAGNAWTVPSAYFTSSQQANFYSVCQVYAYPMVTGVGVLGNSTASFNPDVDSEVMQFFTSASGPTCSLSANLTSVTLGQSVILSWTTTGIPTAASITDGITVVPVSPISGSIVFTPTLPSTTYVLTISNISGISSCQIIITAGSCPPAAGLHQSYPFFQ